MVEAGPIFYEAASVKNSTSLPKADFEKKLNPCRANRGPVLGEKTLKFQVVCPQNGTTVDIKPLGTLEGKISAKNGRFQRQQLRCEWGVR